MPILSYAHLFKIPKSISIPHVFNDDIPAAVKPSYSDIKHFSVEEMAVSVIFCLFVSFFLSFWRNSPQLARSSSFTRFLDLTQRRTTIGRTPLDG